MTPKDFPTTLSWQPSTEKGLMAVVGGRGVVVPTFSVNQVGLVPAPLTVGTTRFLREDGTWGVPPGTGVSSFNGRTGAVTLTSSDVTTALTYTPANVTALANYLLLTGGTINGQMTFTGGINWFDNGLSDSIIIRSGGGFAAGNPYFAFKKTSNTQLDIIGWNGTTTEGTINFVLPGLTHNGNTVLTELGGSIPTGTLSFGSSLRQMLNLWSTTYGLGIQNNTLYFRTAVQFNWFIGGVHSNTVDDPGSGGVLGMRLNGSGSLSLPTGVWHTSLSDNNSRIFYSASSHTYIAAPGNVILRPSGGTTDYYDFGSGQLTLRWGSPTVWWRDSDARGFAIHVNSNIAYMMRGGTDDTTWTQITDAYGTARWMAEWDLSTGQLTMAGILYVANNAQVRDITATRGDGTGVIYLGGSSRYLYYNGTSYQMPTAALTVGGMITGNGGTKGIGNIVTTTSTTAPTGGSSGDLHFIY